MTNRGRATGPQYQNDMTKEELKEKIAAIDRLADTAKKAACLEYVQTNAKYKIGDIVGDSADTIRIESIKFTGLRGDILIYYYGPVLTKKGEPRKDGAKRAVFECNIKNQ